ncbi:MAG: flagellar filament outer layer protein FlaA [Spirochaeta sp.]|nr:flagellar filament outer layer protein FlaA [Spirochaeta sp.]
MKHLRNTLFVVMILLVSGAVWAQQEEVDPSQLGVDSAQQRLQEVSVTRFEDPAFWNVNMSLDTGVLTYRRLAGAPIDKEPIEAETELGIEEGDEYVLGVKAEFFRRGSSTIFVQASRPLAVPGIVKTLSVWVVGRNRQHRMSLVVEDYFGNRNILPFGTMNFSGWRQMTVAIPPTIVQQDSFYSDRSGLQVLGFLIELDQMQTYGQYYVYLDDLRAVTDLFSEEARDPDDMVDGW